MKASELRIGNVILFSNGIQESKDVIVGRRFFSSASIEKEDNDFEVTSYYQGIKITQEWLLKLGFERKYHNEKPVWITQHYMFLDFSFHLDYKENGFVAFNAFNCFLKQVKYVHELQNLYFSLTESELPIN